MTRFAPTCMCLCCCCRGGSTQVCYWAKSRYWAHWPTRRQLLRWVF